MAIIGAGITGAYLYRFLKNKGQEADIFNKQTETSCGINPCGWGTSHEFTELVSASGLNPSLYTLSFSNYVIMHDFKIKASLMTIDKPRLIGDLLQGAKVIYSQPNQSLYDRIIDATGVARAFLPPIENDIVVRCIQFKVKTDAPRSNETSLGRIGYAWCFPLADNTYHIGCGSLSSDPLEVLEGLAWMHNVPSKDILCRCGGEIRLTGPDHSQPFFVASNGQQIWGVGESIGCVPPLVGDGIVSSMKSVKILLDHWHDPFEYTKAIKKEFRWMGRERKAVDKLRSNKNLRLGDVWSLRKNAGRMGIKVGLKDAAMLMKLLK